MGDRVVMRVSAMDKALEGCDRQETALCKSFALSLVRSASTVLAGVRPASLYLFRPSSCPLWEKDLEPTLDEVLACYRTVLARSGITLSIAG